MNKHRNLNPLPTDAAEKKARIQWLLDHKVWTHPVTVPMPLLGDFGDPIESAKHFLGEGEDPSWGLEVTEDGGFYECVDFDFVYVDPHTLSIEEEEARNTELRIRVEAGPWHDMSKDPASEKPAGGWTEWNRWITGHDIRLDCGAPDMEELLLKLAALVECFYNEDGTSKGILWCSWSYQTCEPDENHYCTKCGFLVRD